MEKIQESEYRFPYHQTVDLNGRKLYYMWDGALSYYCRYKLIVNYLNKPGLKKIIEIGCGDGVITSNLACHFEEYSFVGLDYSSRAIDYAKAYSETITNLDFEEFDILQMGVYSNENDVLILTEVLEHIPVDRLSTFISNSVGHVRPDGRIVVTVPSDHKPLEEKHFQHFSKEKLATLFSSSCIVEEIFEIAPRSSILSKLLRMLLMNRYYMLKPNTIIYEWLLSKYFRNFSRTNNGNGVFAVFRKR